MPCLLKADLQSTTVAKPLAQVLLKSLNEGFACILNPLAVNFDPTPTPVCLMDPSVSGTSLNRDGATKGSSLLYFSKSESTAVEQQVPRKMIAQ